MREQVDRLIEKGNVDKLVAVLSGAGVQDFRYVSRRMNELLDDGKLLQHTDKFTRSNDAASRHLACQMIPYAYRENRNQAFELLTRLAKDDDWTLRDAAAGIAGRLLCADFAKALELLRPWAKDDSIALRRCVVIAAMRASKPNRLERAEPLLKLLEPLLEDDDGQLRKNLGPSALAIHLLRDYPTLTFEYLVKWSTSNVPQVLWNVAMAFSGPSAAPLVKKALIVLRKLSLDERRYVWRAVSSAMWKLGRRRPEIVRPELSRWLEDEQRGDVAREALKHL
ncbi:DNA alkylation repair protein [Candidatus Bipolaricaulota bacterium]|nr:DNA alkylation repair protein [Candidatus Bipolaricaulota bacterium]